MGCRQETWHCGVYDIDEKGRLDKVKDQYRAAAAATERQLSCSLRMGLSKGISKAWTVEKTVVGEKADQCTPAPSTLCLRF